jgi:hypothetical protein
MFRARLLPGLAVLALALSGITFAAPSPDPDPEPGGKVGLERLLPDDTFFATVIDLKAIRASALFTRHLKKDFERVLELPAVAKVLKDVGVDPLKEGDRFVIGLNKASFGENPRDEGPFFLVQGKFDEKKVRTILESLGKVVDLGKGKAYEVKGFLSPSESYFAILNRTTVLWAPQKATATAILARVRSGGPATFKVKGFAQALKKIDGKQTVQAVGVEEMVFDSRRTYEKGKPATVKHITLGEKGFKALHLSVSVKDKVKGSMVLTLKDQATRAEKEKLFKDGQMEVVRDGDRAMQREPQIKPMVDAVRNAKISAVNDQLTIAAEVDQEVFKAIINQILREVRP